MLKGEGGEPGRKIPPAIFDHMPRRLTFNTNIANHNLKVEAAETGFVTISPHDPDSDSDSDF